MHAINIGIIGGSHTDDYYCSIAYKVGELLAKKNIVVICGGKEGIMECVSKGVSDNNGIVIGILPGNDKTEGNRYLTIAMPTGIGYMRNFLIVRASDALIAIEGFSGTTSEAAFAISEGKTVVSIGDLDIKRKETDGKLIRASDPEEAVEIAILEATKHAHNKIDKSL
ncbi:TIGR00725 family protein [Picrophilus oshimae]|uniref:TIGR00725 family protein n=1 Tax=Picrophilus torridus (strain ATCC 700027 / DSM 9790 / JCM 10055 / NBRC 100828 / KAW 2/3) TaxID=1122961 RepID=A0A8G2L7Z9_PICTO|nr:TIGR00725 family protein [Picrophilus oshimae]SMD30840.1 hypothetical protein SAMN02745355_0754 [Picrophilus oshimae DSM 9789]